MNKILLKFCLFSLCLFVVFSTSAQADTPADSASALNYLFELTKSKSKDVDVAMLKPLIDFGQSIDVSGQMDVTDEVYGEGVVMRVTLPSTLNRFLKYTYNPDVPVEIACPSSLRQAKWLPGSDILNLSAPLWKKWGTASKPLVLHGEEYEEITPNTDSGSYYSYQLQRMIIAYELENNLKAMISVSLQDNDSSKGKKGFIIGPDENWNYVYTDQIGTTISGLGWAEPAMYSSCTVNIFIENAGGDSVDSVTFKWVNAGWGGINMVERKHLSNGLSRYFSSVKQVLGSSNPLSADDIITEKQRLLSLSQQERLAEFAPYARYLAELALMDSAFSDSAYKDAVKDGIYGKDFTTEQLVSQMLKNYLRKAMHKVDILELPTAQEERDSQAQINQEKDGVSVN